MTEETPNLTLPYIIASQAQKHVTHNEALRRLDALIALTIIDTLTAPPAASAEGATYLVDSSATGAWSGKNGKIANFIDGAWQFLTPKMGWLAWFDAVGEALIFDGSDWVNPLSTGNLSMLGINASPDATNRFALSSVASLFNNAGNDHQIKINKAASTDTASILFQTNWSGRAEIGTAGNDDFSVKVSPDGSNWYTALQIGTDGVVAMPQRPLLKASLDAGTIAPTSGDLVGFDTLDITQGGMTLGSALASGFGNSIIVPTSGAYLLSFNAKIQPTAAFTLELLVNGTDKVSAVSSDTTASGYQTFSAAGMATLGAGDALAFKFTGDANIVTGSGMTELTALLL